MHRGGVNFNWSEIPLYQQLNAIFKTRKTPRREHAIFIQGGVRSFHDRRSCENNSKTKQAHASTSILYIFNRKKL